MAACTIGAASFAPSHARADEVDDAAAALASSDAAAVTAAIAQLGASRSPRAIAPLASRIRQGLPPALLSQAVAAVIGVGTRAAHQVLYELCHHRLAPVRVQALDGLVHTRAPRASALLVGLLDDPSAPVRAAAVAALEAVGPRAAWSELWSAARRGQTEAAALVGRGADTATVRRLSSRVVAADVGPLAETLGAWIRRDDLPRAARTGLVDRLITLDDAARALVRSTAATLPEGDAVRAHAEQALAGAGGAS